MREFSAFRRRSLLLAGFVATVLAAVPVSGIAQADAFPTGPVRVIVPFSAGGVADASARLVAKGLAEMWNQPVTVENLTGAGGNIGMGEVLRRPADGHTIALAPGGNLTINPHYFKNLPFDVEKDFTPVTILADAPNVLVASPKLGVRTLAELIDAGRKAPNGLTYGSPGDGSTQHLAGAMLGMKAQIKTLHIPYRGLAPALTDVMAGQVDMIVVAASTAAPYIKEGKLVPIAVTGPSRLAMLPNVPSMAEGGFPDFNAHSWYSFVVRRGTPDQIVQKIHRDVNAVLQKEKERFVALGLVPSGKGLAEFSALMSEESRRWAGVITAAGIAQK